MLTLHWSLQVLRAHVLNLFFCLSVVVFFPKIAFSNRTGCILDWTKVNSVGPVKPEVELLKNISTHIWNMTTSTVRLHPLILLWFIGAGGLMTCIKVVFILFYLSLHHLMLMQRTCRTQRSNGTTCSSDECLKDFLTCWCGFIESEPKTTKRK